MIGVDVGGTKVAAGFVGPDGTILTQVRTQMVANGSAAEGLAGVTSAIDTLFGTSPERRHTIQGIGICSPAPLDPTTGIVINPPNLPCWRNFPLASETSRIYGVPVKVDNDANAAGLAEALWGLAMDIATCSTPRSVRGSGPANFRRNRLSRSYGCRRGRRTHEY